MAPLPALFRILLVSGTLLSAPLRAEDIDALPITVTFVVSGGFWEDDGAALPDDKAPKPAATPAAPPAAAARRGYYKLIAVRQADRTAKVYLQQVASTDGGPVLVNSVELEEFAAIHPYVTDIRPEDSSGVSRQPGLFATVYLKTDPASAEPEGWTVLIDEFGDIKIEKETN